MELSCYCYWICCLGGVVMVDRYDFVSSNYENCPLSEIRDSFMELQPKEQDWGEYVLFADYEKLAQDYKTLNQINEANDNSYHKLMIDYQSLLIEYGKLVKGS